MTGSKFAARLLLALTVSASLVVAAERVEAASTETTPRHPYLNDRFVFEVGAFYSTSATQIGLSTASGGAGVAVDVNSAFGLNERKLTPIAGFMWRVGGSRRVGMDFFSVKLPATQTAGFDVTRGG